MLEETRTIVSDAELVRAAPPAQSTRRSREKASQSKPAPEKVGNPPARDLILRLIALLKQV